MTQTISPSQLQKFLSQTEPFNQLGVESQKALFSKCQLLQYRMGQTILVHNIMPTQVSIIFQGQARLLGYSAASHIPISLGMVQTGEVLGWAGLVRGVSCETAIASAETIAITIPAADFLAVMAKEPTLKKVFLDHCSISEVFQLAVAELQRRADASTDPKEFASKIYREAVILNLPKGVMTTQQLDPNLIWLVSGGTIQDLPVGSRVDPTQDSYYIESKDGARLLGFREPAPENGHLAVAAAATTSAITTQSVPTENALEIRSAPDYPEAPVEDEYTATQRALYFPHVRGRGPVDGLLACLQMLSKYLGGSIKSDIVQRAIQNQINTVGSISMQVCGALVEMVGLSAQLAQVPSVSISRLKGPALIKWEDSFAVLYKISLKEVVIAIPASGVRRIKIESFVEQLPEQVPVLLVKARVGTANEKFGLASFIPYVKTHSKVLIEVLIASFFILLFTLANPLIVQIIIDKVLVQNSIDTLHVLGFLLIGVALFEALLTALRTYLFVDTTNRIDLNLGTKIIDHLLRLPLNYFDKRRVGELSTRIAELENIRNFMTGTALTVVLDAVFSVIYIVVMFIYNWFLTFVALFTIPFFAILAAIASPIIRSKLRTAAERNADTQSYLVEVLSGVQTVKAQNIELKSRWQWQEKYARYVNANFQTVLTGAWAGSISGFLSKLQDLALLWVGAYLVLNNQLTLGQLIAFRIIAGYVSGPLLRIAQLWQSFQQVGLSIERLSDIMDATQEVTEENRNNIPMPDIEGAVKFENISFRFNPQGPLQLNNINIEFPAGAFIGVVGQSGSGKSTLTKLIQRLYEPATGRIQIDNYDISKVELYSLRRQIGMVLQDTLLFNGTVQENIALANPEATAEQIIEAARVAVAHDFIMTLPNGYNTVVGERGSGLSGGQRQRIAIARTVLQNPRFLILDEATSALDYESERQVCVNLAEAFKGRTVFFITHRLTTLRNADVIIMMDQGAIVEQGTHQELMQLRGRYYCLYQQQESQL